MSVDTNVKLIGRVDAESIAEWIKANVDKYNDSDNEAFVKFEKGSESPITIRHITMADVYEAFGGFVVIDDLYKN